MPIIYLLVIAILSCGTFTRIQSLEQVFPTGVITPKDPYHERIVQKLTGMSTQNLTALRVTVTSYNPVRAQTDNTPLYGSDGKLVTPGILAVSKDLREVYGIKDGDKVLLEGYGVFTVKDSMHPRWKRRVDIMSLIPKYSENFGAKTATLHFNRRYRS